VQSVLVPEHFDYSHKFGSINEHYLMNCTKVVILVIYLRGVPWCNSSLEPG
jgi:hypothetical protein